MNTANLAGRDRLLLLAVVNMFGVKTGAIDSEHLHFREGALSLALVLLAFTIGRDASCNRRELWREGGASSGGTQAGQHCILFKLAWVGPPSW